MNKSFELVISRFSESVNWLSLPPYNKNDVIKTVYNKGKDDLEYSLPITVLPVPNVGRECHTFLHHIVTRYNSLSDCTMFVLGSCQDEGKITKTNQVFKLAYETRDSVFVGVFYENLHRFKNFQIDEWTGSNSSNAERNPSRQCLPASIRPFGLWYKEYFGKLVTNVVAYNSIFAVSKEHILQHPIEYYQKFLDMVSTHPNPEVGHFLERSWVAIFSPLPDRCILAANTSQISLNSSRQPQRDAYASRIDQKLSLKELLGKGTKEKEIVNESQENIRSFERKRSRSRRRSESRDRWNNRNHYSRRNRSRSRSRSRTRSERDHGPRIDKYVGNR